MPKMKIKVIKKANALFAAILFFASSFFIGVFLWSTWENGELEGQMLAGKAETVSTKVSTAENRFADNVEEDNLVEEKILLEESGNVGEELETEDNDGQEEKKVMAEESVKFSFVAIGDSESYKEPSGYNKELVAVLENSRNHRPDIAFFTGDIITASGSSLKENENRIAKLKNLIESYFNNYYILFGKHDVECGKDCALLWQKIFFDFVPASEEENRLYHSFDYQNTHFILLSSDYPSKHSIDSAQLSWLEKDLEANSLPNTIVFQHVPPVTFFEKSAEKCHDMSCDPGTRSKLLELYQKHGVDCVVSGHEHAFDHKIVGGIDYVLSGRSGGDSRYKGTIKGDIYSHFSVDGEKITLKAINTEGKLIREINVK